MTQETMSTSSAVIAGQSVGAGWASIRDERPCRRTGSAARFPVALAAAALVAGAVLAVPAFAAGPSYDHLDIEYAAGDFDDGDLDYETQGLRVRASAQVASNFYVAGSYEYGQVDVDDLPGGNVGDLDSHVVTLGAGAFLRVLDSDAAALDLTGEAFFIRADLEKNTDTGWGASFGPRLRLADRFELQAEATYFDVGEDGVWTFGAYGQVDVTKLVAVRAGVSVDEDNDLVVYSLGARVNLGEQ